VAATPVRALAKRASRDQVGLSARERGAAQIRLRKLGANLAPNALDISKSGQLPPGVQVLLFDDVVTTGATLAGARQALTEQGFQVVGAVVLAATPPRSYQPQTPAGGGRTENVRRRH